MEKFLRDYRIVTAKAPSTPGDFSQGVLDSLAIAADKLGLTTEALGEGTARMLAAAGGKVVFPPTLLPDAIERMGADWTDPSRQVVSGAFRLAGRNRTRAWRAADALVSGGVERMHGDVIGAYVFVHLLGGGADAR